MFHGRSWGRRVIYRRLLHRMARINGLAWVIHRRRHRVNRSRSRMINRVLRIRSHWIRRMRGQGRIRMIARVVDARRRHDAASIRRGRSEHGTTRSSSFVEDRAHRKCMVKRSCADIGRVYVDRGYRMDAHRIAKFDSSDGASFGVCFGDHDVEAVFEPSTRITDVADAAETGILAVVVGAEARTPRCQTFCFRHAALEAVGPGEVAAQDHSEAWDESRSSVEMPGLVSCPVAVIETLLAAVAVRAHPAVVVRIPADVIGTVVEPGDAVVVVVELGPVKRQPDPAVRRVMAPSTVVVGHPAPGVVRNPGPAIAVAVLVAGPGPIAVLIRNPVRLVDVRDEVAHAFDDDPAALTGKAHLRIEGRVGVRRWIRHDLSRRSVVRASKRRIV